MKILLSIILLVLVFQKDRFQGSLSPRDYELAPIPFSAKTDSLIGAIGPPTSIERVEGFCGKGPRMRGSEVIEGDTTYCDSMIVFHFDSLTVCVKKEGGVEFYDFTMKTMATMRGIHIGDTKEAILLAYGEPTWMDSAYVFDERLPGEDDEIQYVGVDDYNGIAFFLTKGLVHRIYIGRGTAC